MIARLKMSQNEWKTTEIRASKVGNFSPFSCPGGVTWATLVLAMPIYNRAMEYQFESELAKHGLEDLINTRTKEGNSILHYVAFVGCEWACRILLAKSELRLLVAERNKYGFHAPALAVLFDNDEVETLLYAWFHASRDAVDRKVNGNIRRNVRMTNIKRRSQMEENAKSGTSHVHNSANRANKKEAKAAKRESAAAKKDATRAAAGLLGGETAAKSKQGRISFASHATAAHAAHRASSGRAR